MTRLQQRLDALTREMYDSANRRTWGRILGHLTDDELNRLERMPLAEWHGRPVREARDAAAEIVLILKKAASRITTSDDVGAAACLEMAADIEEQLSTP